MPAGLSLDASTGVISGTPSATSGTSVLTVTVTDSDSPPASASAALSIMVLPALSVTTGALPSAVEGSPYSPPAPLASGGVPPYTWSISVGALPAGLILNPTTGAISGTPMASGVFPFTVEVTDSIGDTATADEVLTVLAPLVVTTSFLPPVGGVFGVPYSATLTATGGVAPYTWSISAGELPAGLTLDPSTGVISGTPTGLGLGSSFTVTVTDSENPADSASADLSIGVAPESVDTSIG